MGRFFLSFCFIFLFPSIFLFGKSVSNIASEEFPNYALRINKAYNFFEKERIAEASLIANQLKNRYPHQADSYYLLGLIHLKYKLPRLAEEYFKKSEEFSGTFLQKSMLLSLYFYLAKLEFQKGALEKEAEYLNTILGLAKGKRQLYLTMAGRSHFLLGFNYRRQEKWEAAEYHFKKAIEHGYKSKIANLLLARYYAFFNEQQIEEHIFAKSGEIKKFDAIERQKRFLFYYRLFRKTKSLLEMQEIRENKQYSGFLNTVEGYYLSLLKKK